MTAATYVYVTREFQEQCERRVVSRTELRGQFNNVFDLIERNGGNPLVIEAYREDLDRNYPPLSMKEC